MDARGSCAGARFAPPNPVPARASPLQRKAPACFLSRAGAVPCADLSRATRFHQGREVQETPSGPAAAASQSPVNADGTVQAFTVEHTADSSLPLTPYGHLTRGLSDSNRERAP